MTDKITRTSAGLREALFEELDRLRAGESDPQKASAFARISGEIVKTVHMEMKYHLLGDKKANGKVATPNMMEPMQLGAPVE